MPYPGRPMPYPGGPMMWHGGGGPGFAVEGGYQYGPGTAPCGCGGYSMTWVPIHIETRYHYSPAIRHERDVVEEHVVNEEVVEHYTPRVHGTKYTKRAPTKMTKQTKKVTRSTK